MIDLNPELSHSWGSCHLTRNCFEEINFPDDFLKFSVQGQDLLSALSIVPGGTLELSMIEEGEPLTLKVIDEGVVLGKISESN